ncbi:MAG: glycoside hydrolase family 3 C-terminal domain-containing protein [Lachnospiraceae bacterium]|nr:glycoside hydrolase family 3 C-terminal domain-containing protein [Lachnospiraceae bacterium]
MMLTELERINAGKVRGLQAECTVLLKKNGDFPLDGPCRLALYGNGARNTLRGGTGSGEVYSHFTVSIEKALEKAGFTITTKNWLDEYDKDAKKSRKAFVEGIKQRAKEKHVSPIFEGMGAVMPEPEYDIPIECDGDAAVYVLSRICGEGNDRVAEKGDILLTDTEISTILGLYRKFDKFILVLNVGGPVDLTPVLDVENILLLSQLGALTGYAFSDILLGKKTPSGKLATTWTAWDAYPEIFDFGDAEDTRYKEGIYVGYRYFNTVGAKTLFPFGYGLSYTDFEIGATGTELNGENVTVSFIVENTGDFGGKEVVQLYISKPKGKLDQPKEELAGWVKTEKLDAKQITKTSVTFAMSDIASYDTESGSYILEKGDYVISYGNNSADITPCAIVRLSDDAVVKQVKNIGGTPDFEDYKPQVNTGEAGIEYEKTNASMPILVLDCNAVKKENPVYDTETEVTDEVKALSDEELIYLNIGAFFENGVGGSMIGNAGRLVAGAAGETTDKLRCKGIPSLSMADGPAGVRISQKYWVDEDGAHSVGNTMLEGLADFLPKPAVIMGKLLSKDKPRHGEKIETHYATAIPIGTALAQSWNLKLVERCGDIVGSEMEEFGVHLWLAPAMNIHRNIRCGRNFEYYSEDPLVSGKMAAAITKGVQKHKNCGVTIKHYCVNNQEYNRCFNNSIVSERAMREIYLKGYGICVKEAQPATVMSSYNLLNGIHTNERRDLLENVLRDEFGFKGSVMTDWLIASVPNLGTKHPKYSPSRIAAAGGEIVMPGSREDFEDMKTALNNGSLTRKQLEINATRLIRVIRLLTT